jgi:thiamine biosynthesis protein ThiS
MSETAEIQITANGESYTIPCESTLIAFLESRELSIKRVVVEHNGNPLSPSEASDLVLQNGDKLEIVHIVAGG